MAEENQWEMIVEKLEGHINDALSRKKRVSAKNTDKPNMAAAAA